MWQGNVKGLYISRQAGTLPSSVTFVDAVPGRGLVGDRYYLGTGTYSNKPGYGGREITLIESEVLEQLLEGVINAEGEKYGLALSPEESRRNVLTRGVPLSHLIGREFLVGEVVLLGVRACEPCAHLERITRPGVFRSLVHRGGLRAKIQVAGQIAVGDVIRPA